MADDQATIDQKEVIVQYPAAKKSRRKGFLKIRSICESSYATNKPEAGASFLQAAS